MSEPKFTPGPWKFEDEYVRAFDGEIVADIYTRPTADAGDEMEANAHLIKAAPDLYAALAAFVSVADSQDKPSIANQGQAMDGYSLLANLMACVPAARAALSKARGE